MKPTTRLDKEQLDISEDRKQKIFNEALKEKELQINDLAYQIKELNEVIKTQEFKIARRDVIIRFLSEGKADRNGLPIIGVDNAS